MNSISLATADIPLKSYANIFDCLRKGRIGRGKYVALLEERAADYFGVRHCIAVSSGTLADIIILATLKELYPGKDEVIMPALTFIAQANAVIWAGLRPVFVDVDVDFQMDLKATMKAVSDRTLCIFPVHLLGKACQLMAPASIPVVEDCCEAMGGTYQVDGTKKLGTFGLAASFSMYPSHTITTGEGGLIVTDSDAFAQIARSIHNHGKIASDFDFSFVGINAKMTNLQAAIGCELIGRIDSVNGKRRKNLEIYSELLRYFHATAPHCYPFVCKSKADRNAALLALADKGIEARKLMGCVPDAEPYIRRFGFTEPEAFPNSRKFADCGLFVPVHQNLKPTDIYRIVDVLSTFA